MKKETVAVIVLIIVLLSLLGSCMGDSEYETAGKEFGSWVNEGPENWSDTEREYFNNFMEWSDKN